MTYKRAIGLVFSSLLLLVFAGLLVADEQEIVPIVVSPNVINLESEGTWVTIHADIDYSVVVQESVEVFLDGIPVEVTKSDARGDLVAKFLLDDVIDLLDLEPGIKELTLTGVTADGGVRFSGLDVVLVIQRAGKR